MTWYLVWFDANGKEHRENTPYVSEPHPTKARMRAISRNVRDYARQRRREMENEQRALGGITPISLTDGLEAYIDRIRAKGPDGILRRAKGTADNVERHITAFINEFLLPRKYYAPTKFHMHLVTRNMLALWRDWLESQGYMPGTINAMLGAISAWFRWAVDYGHSPINPVHGLERLRMPVERVHIPLIDSMWMRDELRRIIAAIRNPQMSLAATVLATTGLRQGELKLLRTTNVDLKARILTVPPGRETTKIHGRRVPLCKQARMALAGLLVRFEDGADRYLVTSIRDPLKPITGQFSVALKRVGFTPHDLRRFFITALETIGTPKTVVDDLAGHSPGKVRQAYTPETNIEAALPWIHRFEDWLGDVEPKR